MPGRKEVSSSCAGGVEEFAKCELEWLIWNELTDKISEKHS
jgi:hypothetical protein